MKYPFLASWLLLTGCSTAPAPTAQQAAVTAFIRSNLPDSASYEPVSWNKMGIFRTRDAVAFDLPDASRQFVETTAKLRHDSANYLLLCTNARRFNISDQNLVNAKMVYQMALTHRDAARVALRHALATKDDTTRLGYRLVHVFRANTEAGKLALDSAGFLVNLHGVVITNVPAHDFIFSSGPSNRARFLEMAPPPPPPNDLVLDGVRTPEQLKAYLKEPMKR